MGKFVFQVSGNLTNLGNDVTFFVTDPQSVTFSLGPLPYVYKLSHMKFHFGRKDGMGTEHTIDGKQFDAEVHSTFFTRKKERKSHKRARVFI